MNSMYLMRTSGEPVYAGSTDIEANYKDYLNLIHVETVNTYDIHGGTDLTNNGVTIRTNHIGAEDRVLKMDKKQSM